MKQNDCSHDYTGTYTTGVTCIKCDMSPIWFARDMPKTVICKECGLDKGKYFTICPHCGGNDELG